MEMANNSATLLLVALLCASAIAATRTSLQSVTSLDHVGVCESIVESQGYTCEEHKLTTEDGYILGLQRIPNGRSGNVTDDKLPVLLQHGILLDASSWMLNSPDQDLPFILADNGFDVWIANTRGTKSSRGHTSLSPNDAAYWDWSWDELVAFELPAIVQYVNKQTGQKLHYVGHSLGSLTALAALSKGKLVKLLRSAALLSPVAYLGQTSSPIIRAASELFLAEATRFLGFPNAPNRQLTQLGKLICRRAGIACSNLLSAFVGPNCCLSSSGLDNLYKYEPQPTATKNFVHLAQMIRRGTIEMYDYGNADANMEHYKQFTPPVYNMENILKDVPLFLSNGGTDLLSDVNDVKRLLNDLRGHDKDKLIVLFRPEYAHMDFIMARNANQFVYEPLMAFFKSH